jgi:glutamate dehydrogenase (NADP+)
MGGGKGGADFDPGKSDNEVMRFVKVSWQSCPDISEQTQMFQQDIGVGGREVGFMFGQYKRLRNEQEF